MAALPLARDYLIVVSNTSLREALAIYRLRWGIEVLFFSLKSRGFNFEETHLIDRERIKKLVVLLALAFGRTWWGCGWPKARRLRSRSMGVWRGVCSVRGWISCSMCCSAHQRAVFAECVWLLIAPLSEPGTLEIAHS